MHGGHVVRSANEASGSYTILIRSRPRRVAFLVDEEHLNHDVIDAIYSFNLNHWGGRFNPVVPTTEGNIRDDYKRLLEFVDPDVVYSYGSLSEPTVQYLDREVQPWKALKHRYCDRPGEEPDHSPWISHEGLSVEPLVAHAAAPHWHAFSQPFLVRYEGDKNWPYHRFVLRNFGVFERDWPTPGAGFYATAFIKPSAALDETFTFIVQQARTREIVFPVRWCTDFVEFAEQRSHPQADCLVTVGDDVRNSVYAWNYLLLLSPWMRRHLPVLWLPSIVAEDAELVAALGQFLRVQLAYSSSDFPTAMVTSFDWPRASLQKVADRLLDAMGDGGVALLPPPADEELPVGPALTDLAERSFSLTQAHSRRAYVHVPPPLPRGGRFRGCWMVDVEIRDAAGKFAKLPRRSQVARLFAPENAYRVDRQHRLTCQVEADRQPLLLTIPDDDAVWAGILAQPSRPREIADVRPVRPAACRQCPISDKGRYLQGLLGLFRDLREAATPFRDGFLRRAIYELSGRPRQVDERTRESLGKALAKDGRRLLSDLRRDPARACDWIADKALQHLGGQPAHVMNFDWFLQRVLAGKRLAASSDVSEDRGDGAHASARSRWQVELEWLVEKKVLFQGFSPRCPNCGLVEWYSLDDAHHVIQCRGCLGEIRIAPEQEWYYALNTLVASAVGQFGVVPLVLALAQLSEQARESFMFRPSTELYQNVEQDGPSAEIDILCVIDGKLFIGEVKTRASQFGGAQEERLLEVAEKLHADVVVLAAIAGRMGVLHEAGKRIAERLRTSGTEVCVVPAPWLEDPRYYC